MKTKLECSFNVNALRFGKPRFKLACVTPCLTARVPLRSLTPYLFVPDMSCSRFNFRASSPVNM